MAVFTKKTDDNGVVRYRNVTENKPVAKDKLSAELLARLDIAPEGTEVPESPDIDETVNEVAKAPTKGKVRKINLLHPILVNGKVYQRGDITVPEEMADDLLRIDEENTQYEANLMKDQGKALMAGEVRAQDVQ